MNQELKVDINSASLEELINVKGIGPALAEKIINNRPFSSLDDLAQVQGIGTTSLKSIKSNLVIQPQEPNSDFEAFVESIRGETKSPVLDVEEDVSQESFQAEEEVEPESTWHSVNMADSDSEDLIQEIPGEDNSEPDILEGDVKILEDNDLEKDLVFEEHIELEDPETEEDSPIHEVIKETKKTTDKEIELNVEESSEEKPTHEVFQESSKPTEKVIEIEKQTSSEDWITRSQLIWSMIGTAVFSIILTALITLGILSATNDGLRYATVNDAARIENEIALLNDLTTTMKTDIESMKSRLDTLETVASRVTTLETRADDVDNQIEVIQSSIQEISETLLTVQEEIKALQIAAEKSSEFRSGLMQLLLEIDGTTEEGR
jgi:competence ComEA-like helix-hairpin-helix protein